MAGPRAATRNIRMKKTVFAAVALLLAACSPKTAVLSPDGRIAVRFSLSESGIPSYSVDVDGQPLLEPSVMGLVSDDAIERAAFEQCTNLTEIISLNPKAPSIVYGSAFDQTVEQNATLYVPVGSKEAYSTADYWKNFVHIEEKDFTTDD